MLAAKPLCRAVTYSGLQVENSRRSTYVESALQLTGWIRFVGSRLIRERRVDEDIVPIDK